MRGLGVGLPLAAIALVAAGVAVGQVTARSGDPTVTRTPLAQSTKVRGLLHKAKIVDLPRDAAEDRRAALDAQRLTPISLVCAGRGRGMRQEDTYES